MKLDRQFKDSIIERARYEVKEVFPGKPLGRMCLPLSLAIGSILEEQGIDTNLFAGTAMFPVVPPNEDDGNQATHHSFVFDPDIAELQSLFGNFPEMHVWIVCRGEVIDATCGAQTRHGIKQGIKVENPIKLPDYLWGDPCDYGISYVPHPAGKRMAFKIAHQMRRSAICDLISIVVEGAR